MYSKIIPILITFFICTGTVSAQDTSAFMIQLQQEVLQNETIYTTATFKSTRIINGHSAETLPAHVLDLRISHRFGTLSSGIYNFFGLDNATMRLGFDYGITNNVMIGVGHSTYQKTYDGFLKVKLLRQSSGNVHMPVTLTFLSSIAVNTLKAQDFSVKPDAGTSVNRKAYVLQFLLARKFSQQFSLQLMPTYIHSDNISFLHPQPGIFALGIGGRQTLSKRISLNAEYYYQFGDRQPGTQNVLSFGIDIGTGGHVFQLHFTNSTGMVEKSFITETTGRWDKSDVLFGFNISRVFQLKKKQK